MSVLIAVPTFETIKPETFKAIYGLDTSDCGLVNFDYVRGYDCARARNQIAQEAINYNFDYVLMVDSDIVLPPTALKHMLETPVDICLGIYPRKNTTTGQTEIFKLGQKDFVDANNLNISELIECPDRLDIKGGGFGCALISTEVFMELPKPWFRYVEYADGSLLSEDNYFCFTAAEAGFSIQADTRVRCSHLMQIFSSM